MFDWPARMNTFTLLLLVWTLCADAVRPSANKLITAPTAAY